MALLGLPNTLCAHWDTSKPMLVCMSLRGPSLTLMHFTGLTLDKTCQPNNSSQPLREPNFKPPLFLLKLVLSPNFPSWIQHDVLPRTGKAMPAFTILASIFIHCWCCQLLGSSHLRCSPENWGVLGSCSGSQSREVTKAPLLTSAMVCNVIKVQNGIFLAHT